MKKRTGFTQIVMAIITIIAITSSMVLNGSSAVAQPGMNQGEDLNLPDLNLLDLNLPDLNLTAGILSGIRSYIYGYPLVMMGITQRLTTNVPNLAMLGRAPKNQFAHATELPDASYVDVQLPNVNTLYSLAFLDLSTEPIILHLPDMGTRFFLLEVLDAWTNVNPNSPGTRVGTQAGNYAFVGPQWQGTLPVGITQVYTMPTSTMWIIGRIYTDGSQQDIDYIDNNLHPNMTLTPLSSFGQPYTPPATSPIDPATDAVTIPFVQAGDMDACAFFGMLAALMIYNPPVPADTQAVGWLADIGVTPGQTFSCSTLTPNQRAELQTAVRIGNAMVNYVSQHVSQPVNGWQLTLGLGIYGTRYLVRAAIARVGLGTNYYLDAVYAGAFVDAAGQTLNGANRYTLHFDAGQFPPSNPQAFWSVTMYNAELLNLVDNAINRNALGIPAVQEHVPCLNADGSLTLYIQTDPPDPTTQPTQYCNWLPAPEGNFILLMRIYWPDQTLLDQQWVPPGVQRVS